MVVFLILLELAQGGGDITVGGVALAMSIPTVPERGTIVTITYIIVVFSIIAQGMTLGRLVKQIYPHVED